MENVLTMTEAIVVNARWDISLIQLARNVWVRDIVPDMLRVSLFASRLAVRGLQFKFTGITNNDIGEIFRNDHGKDNENTKNQCYA